jgi:hypothetical protein
MNTPSEILNALQGNTALYQEILAAVEREGQSLRRLDSPNTFELFQGKKSLLPRLNQSLDQLKEYRAAWQKMIPEERARNPQIASLLRQHQDVIMKIILLDRENEQTLLRRGLVPVRQLPAMNRQRPLFVAEIYRRGAIN